MGLRHGVEQVGHVGYRSLYCADLYLSLRWPPEPSGDPWRFPEASRSNFVRDESRRSKKRYIRLEIEVFKSNNHWAVVSFVLGCVHLVVDRTDRCLNISVD